MARIIALDSGPLGLLTAPESGRHPEVSQCRFWLNLAKSSGVWFILPQIVEYEYRRSLLARNALAATERLDRLKANDVRLVPIVPESLDRAAELWAETRRRGEPTAPDRSLDIDAILAAQALGFAGLGDTLTIATGNARHLGRFAGIDARPWQAIRP